MQENNVVEERKVTEKVERVEEMRKNGWNWRK